MTKINKHNTKSPKTLLYLILLIAFLIRIWGIMAIPPSLTPDEAALGYNAFSILKTGRDEHGELFPIVFKSFGDYKPGFYIYLTVPMVAIFGLSEFSVRIVSVIAGVFCVYLLFLITGHLFTRHRNFSLMSAFVAALNPFLIYFSRGAWEANLSLAFTLAGIYFFLKSLRNGRLLTISSIFFALTFLTYQGAKFSTSAVLLILILSFYNEIKNLGARDIAKAIIAGFVVSLPIVYSVLSGQVKRLMIFSVFSYPRPFEEIELYKGILFNVFHSDFLNYIRMILSRWFNFYSGHFMFIAGDAANPVHTAPYQGVLLISDLLLVPLGLYAYLKNKLNREYLFFFLWLLIVPLSAALSRDQTNAVRSLNASVPLVILVTFGLWYIVFWRREFVFRVLKILILPIYVFGLLYFIDAYFIHLPVHNADYWRYGYKQAVAKISNYENKFDRIYFEQSFNQPYIYFLFYRAQTNPGENNPVNWQSQANLTESEYKGDVGYQTKIDNIYFDKPDWSKLRNYSNSLIVVNPAIVPPEIKNDSENFEVLDEIKYPKSNISAFEIIRIK